LDTHTRADTHSHIHNALDTHTLADTHIHNTLDTHTRADTHRRMCVCATSFFFLSPNCSPGRPQLSGYCSDGLLWAFKKKVQGSNRRKGHQKRAYWGWGEGG